MKELSVKEKAQRYDEILARATGADMPYYKEDIMSKVKEFVYYLIPELKGGEDERIRKDIVTYLKSTLSNKKYGDKFIESWIAWLEKQGKQPKKHDVCDNCDQQGSCVSPCPMKLVEKQDEQKPTEEYNITGIKSKHAQGKLGEMIKNLKLDKVEPKFKVGDVVTNKKSKDTVKIVQILHDSYCYSGWDGAATVYSDFSISEQDGWELVEQNPTWSEKDENMLQSILDEYKSMLTEKRNWLKSLKDRVQPQLKQEWNEEDEINLNFITRVIERLYDKQEKNYLKESLEGKINWLRSLKDRVQPQPVWSKEDDETLCRCISATFDHGYLKECNWLKSFRPQSQWKPSDLPHWKKSNLPNNNTTGFNSDYFCHKGYCINYKELFEKLPKDD